MGSTLANRIDKHVNRLHFLFLILGMHLGMQTVPAQVVYTEPAFPTLDQPVTIYFDATQGNAGLQGFTGDVYAHTGVITQESSSTSDWKYVIADWYTNIPEAKMNREGADVYSLHIEDISAYYGIADTEEVHQLAFVFRSADRSRVARDSGDEDIFVDVYSELVNVRFDSPSMPVFGPLMVDPGSTVAFEASAFGQQGRIVRMELFVNEQLVQQTDSSRIIHEYSFQQPGTYRVVVVGTDEHGNSDVTIAAVLVHDVVAEIPVPAGHRLGINYYDEHDKVTLVLWAPDKEFVYLIGDFNDWQPSGDFLMHRETARPDSVLYWITLENLEPGVEYGYQYLIDGELRLSDPFSHKVLSPWNDRWISESVYPDLKEYPHGKSEHIVSILQTAQQPWQWQASDFVRPAPSELVIYELLIRDFLADATYSTLADTLDYLKRLGINAVQLMPVSNFDGNDSWGYNPNHHLALDKAYGPAHTFRHFIDEAHKREMAVILDVVYNHATGSSPLIRLYGNSRDTNPLIGPGHQFSVFYHLNHDHPFIKYWLDRANRYWLEEFNIDGYRFDLTKGFATNVQNPAMLQGPNAERIANLKRMADQLWSFDPDAYIILEHFADNQEEIQLAHYGIEQGRAGMLLWGNHNFNYSEATMGWHDDGKSNFSGVYHKNRGWNVPNLIGYMESHDEQWLMFKNRNYGNGMGSYQIRALSTALDRQKLAGAFFFTIPGPKMVWQFGELGYGGGPQECLKPGDGTDGDCQGSDPGRTDRKPVRWNYYHNTDRNALYQTWQWLLKLRHENAVFHDPQTEVSMYGMSTASKTITLQHEHMQATVLGNFGVTEGAVFPRFTQTGLWYDYFSGDALDVTSEMTASDYSMELAPGTFHIFTTEQLETPPMGIVPVPTQAYDSAEGSGYDRSFVLHPSYPNPFNPVATISYEISEPSFVELQIFNILGQQVATLEYDYQQAGLYQRQFDASGLGSGTYIVQIRAGDFRAAHKIMLVK